MFKDILDEINDINDPYTREIIAAEIMNATDFFLKEAEEDLDKEAGVAGAAVTGLKLLAKPLWKAQKTMLKATYDPKQAGKLMAGGAAAYTGYKALSHGGKDAVGTITDAVVPLKADVKSAIGQLKETANESAQNNAVIDTIKKSASDDIYKDLDNVTKEDSQRIQRNGELLGAGVGATAVSALPMLEKNIRHLPIKSKAVALAAPALIGGIIGKNVGQRAGYTKSVAVATNDREQLINNYAMNTPNPLETSNSIHANIANRYITPEMLKANNKHANDESIDLQKFASGSKHANDENIDLQKFAEDLVDSEESNKIKQTILSAGTVLLGAGAGYAAVRGGAPVLARSIDNEYVAKGLDMAAGKAGKEVVRGVTKGKFITGLLGDAAIQGGKILGNPSRGRVTYETVSGKPTLADQAKTIGLVGTGLVGAAVAEEYLSDRVKNTYHDLFDKKAYETYNYYDDYDTPSSAEIAVETVLGGTGLGALTGYGLDSINRKKLLDRLKQYKQDDIEKAKSVLLKAKTDNMIFGTKLSRQKMLEAESKLKYISDMEQIFPPMKYKNTLKGTAIGAGAGIGLGSGLIAYNYYKDASDNLDIEGIVKQADMDRLLGERIIKPAILTSTFFIPMAGISHVVGRNLYGGFEPIGKNRPQVDNSVVIDIPTEELLSRKKKVVIDNKDINKTAGIIDPRKFTKTFGSASDVDEMSPRWKSIIEKIHDENTNPIEMIDDYKGNRKKQAIDNWIDATSTNPLVEGFKKNVARPFSNTIELGGQSYRGRKAAGHFILEEVPFKFVESMAYTAPMIGVGLLTGRNLKRGFEPVDQSAYGNNQPPLQPGMTRLVVQQPRSREVL